MKIEEALEAGVLSAVHAARWPDRIAVQDPASHRTFRALHENANRLARVIRAAGLKPGDGIALMCSNRCEFVEAFLASQRTGLRLTPVNWHLSAAEAAYIVEDCEARAIIAEDRFVTGEWSDTLSGLDLRLSIGGAAKGWQAYDAALAAESGEDLPGPVHGTIMLYTSGTTGRPKGVLRRKPEPVAPQLAGSFTAYDPDTDVQLCCGPAYHAAPLLFDIRWPLASGVRIILMDAWDSCRVLETIARERITHAHMVPIMFQRLLALPEEIRSSFNVSSVRKIFHGAAPCPPEVKRAMIDWFGPVLHEYYAGSEGGAGIHITSQEWLQKPGSVGRIPADGSVRILAESGEPVAPGQDGMIYHAADTSNPFEYFKAPEKTAAQSRDGYFTLGDIGHVDEDGFLFLTGRSAECIISGGVNIYPQEIDDAIARHPGVADVCTIGAPNTEWGEEVRAVIQLKPGYTASDALAAEILRTAGETLSKFKHPRAVDFVDELPRLPSGKIPRERVRAPYWAGREKKI
jgi:long-chain acyl-CoA synthetase